jgi:ABC-type dipeptide/oligopeptide/nickel transport system permease component
MVLLFIIFGTFILIRQVPGGPFDSINGRSMPKAVRAALQVRFGLDKPLLLNLPTSAVVPDIGTRFGQGQFIHLLNDGTEVISPEMAFQTNERLPDCDKLRQGLSRTEAISAPEIRSGWQLIYWTTERIPTTTTINEGRPTRCFETRRVVYSDLTRSQFFQYLNNMLRFDLGPSMSRTTLGQPVTELISDRLPVSMQIGIYSVILGFLVGIPLGVLAAIYRNSIIDYVVTIFAVLFASIPSLVLGPLLILIFVVQFKILPAPDPRVWKSGNLFDWNYLGRAILPIMIVGLGMSAGIARLTRASLLQVLRDDYIRTARAKGMRERGVLYIHALKNALIPVATILGPLLATVLTGTLIIERIFSIPGLGSTFVDSVAARDYNLLCGVTILYSTFLILGNMLVDIMYTWLDPRIRFD